MVEYSRFSNKFLKLKYYLTKTNKNIFLISNNGLIFKINKADLINSNHFNLINIKSNLEDIIDKNYISNKQTIIKGIEFINDEFYVSYIKNNNNCFSNSILKGKFKNNQLRFDNFFELPQCKKRFNYQTGGNLQKYKNDKILMTVGDYMSYEKDFENDPQNKKSYFGKIISIDLKTKKIEIISMGHRNQQGLFYDEINDTIFSTEHGPQGGDEININKKPDPKNIKNFGGLFLLMVSTMGFQSIPIINYIKQLP